jgi:hypothetical protein
MVAAGAVGKEKKVTVKDDNDDDVEIEAQNDDDEIEEPKLTKVRTIQYLSP